MALPPYFTTVQVPTFRFPTVGMRQVYPGAAERPWYVSAMPQRGGIAFGTDGWRDIIGFGFTADNLARATRAYASLLLDEDAELVVVGHDARFLGPRFARLVADVLADEGLDVALAEGPIPTPVVSFAVRHLAAAGGVMLTASHNPPAYQGFKLKGPYGGTATTAIYRSVSERVAPASERADVGHGARRRGARLRGTIAPLDIRDAYYGALARLVDVAALAGLDGRVVHDAMGGAAGGWLDGFMVHAGLHVRVAPVRAAPDPTFGGVNPEPIPANLGPTVARMRDDAALFATATDGDGDRLGVVLPGGAYFDSHQIFAVLLDLMDARGEAGRVVKTFTVSRIIERLAVARGHSVVETPVGFKHIVDAFLEGGVLIGGEESGGIGVAGHIPERDGIANSLLLLEAIARRGAPLGEIFVDLERETGWRHAYDRRDLHLAPEHKEHVLELLRDPPARMAGRAVLSVERLDGVKLNLEDQAWLLFRASGTEPVLRIYCEAATQAGVNDILDLAERLISGEPT